jgi:hypothetical protein
MSQYEPPATPSDDGASSEVDASLPYAVSDVPFPELTMAELADLWWSSLDAVDRVQTHATQREILAELVEADPALAKEYRDEAATLRDWAYLKTTWPTTAERDGTNDEDKPVWVEAADARRRAEKEERAAAKAAAKLKEKEEAKAAMAEKVAKAMAAMRAKAEEAKVKPIVAGKSSRYGIVCS